MLPTIIIVGNLNIIHNYCDSSDEIRRSTINSNFNPRRDIKFINLSNPYSTEWLQGLNYETQNIVFLYG